MEKPAEPSREHTASRLPTYRHADLHKTDSLDLAPSPRPLPTKVSPDSSHGQVQRAQAQGAGRTGSSVLTANPANSANPANPLQYMRNASTSNLTTATTRTSAREPSSSSSSGGATIESKSSPGSSTAAAAAVARHTTSTSTLSYYLYSDRLQSAPVAAQKHDPNRLQIPSAPAPPTYLTTTTTTTTTTNNNNNHNNNNNNNTTNTNTNTNTSRTTSSTPRIRRRGTVPATQTEESSRSKNGPPRSMITQGFYNTNPSTTTITTAPTTTTSPSTFTSTSTWPAHRPMPIAISPTSGASEKPPSYIGAGIAGTTHPHSHSHSHSHSTSASTSRETRRPRSFGSRLSLPDSTTRAKSTLSPLTTTTTTAQRTRPQSISIKPIRAFKPSSRKSVEMGSRRASQQLDPDFTMRGLDGFDAPRRRTREMDGQGSEESDLFLRAAQEEGMRQSNGQPTDNYANGDAAVQADTRRSRIGQRASLPPSNISRPTLSRRRGSEQVTTNGTSTMERQESIAQALTYRPGGRERPSALDEINRTRYNGLTSRSTPTTPRGHPGDSENPPELHGGYGGRRPSAPDATFPPRASYRQSNLSYSTGRTYNSSPLVSRNAETTHIQDATETPLPAEGGTESSVSTTAPSTVWDDLEDLKSRINRLELTGKLPPSSGAAMSRASHDRPPTAGTTNTTISSSPKQRGRANSISPIDGAIARIPVEAHPLLVAALAKSKTLLTPEIYQALEATTSDALAISSMMGTSGQPGPISSSQSTLNGDAPAVSDRQVRRKADSMCRSLTELCLALSEGKRQESRASVVAPQNDADIVLPSIEPTNTQRNKQLTITTDLAPLKTSPSRALSRLEARRASMIATSALPSPLFNLTESPTPTAQTPTAGRRTSMLIRNRRAVTQDPEDEEASRFRAPSRAVTEVGLGRRRNPPVSYNQHQQQEEEPPERSPSVQSSLPVRRHYASTSLINTVPPAIPPASMSNSGNVGRYYDRSTPDRDTGSVVGSIAEERQQRPQRMASLGTNFALGRTNSLSRHKRPTPSIVSHGGHQAGYQ